MRSRLFPLLILLVSLFGCGSSTKQEGQATPLIYDFRPGRANLNPGTSTLLLANFVGGSASIDQGVGVISSGVPVSISPTTSTTYTLTVKGTSGDPATASTTVTVGPTAVDISPAQLSLAAGQTQTFSANVTGLTDTRVVWSAEGGTITQQGRFTAGAIPGAYLISAQSLGLSTLCAKAFVTVVAGAPPPPVSVSVSVPTAVLSTGRSTTFSAQVTGSANGAVTWTASAGSISATGVFTAPASPGVVIITATSVADPSKSASTNLTVIAAPVATGLAAAKGTLTVGSATTLTPTFANGTATLGTSGVGSSQLSAAATSGVAVATGPLGATTTFTLTVTNAAGDTATASTTVSAVAAPVATGLVAAKGTLTVGSATTLTPTFANGTATLGTSGVGSSQLSAAASSGLAVATGPLGATTTFTLTVTNAAGDTATASTTVSAVPVATASLVASSASPLFGAPNVTVTPTFTNGTAVVGTSQGASDVLASATAGVALAVQATGFKTATTYWIRVTNPAGDYVDASTTIAPQAVVVGAISPGTPTRTVATSTTFSSTVTGGFLGTITWSSTGGTWVGSSWTAPAVPSSITLTATSLDDPSKTATTLVTVVAAPVATSLVATKGTITAGTGTTVTPTFANGTGEIGTAGAGSSNLSASATSGVALSTGALAATTTFTLTVTNTAGDTATVGTTVSTVPAPVANLTPSTTSPLYGATNTTITPTFTGGTALVGTSQGASDLSASAVSGSPIVVQATGFTAAVTFWVRVTNPVGDFADASATLTPQTVVVGAVTPPASFVTVSTTTTFTSTVTGGALGTVTWDSGGVGSWSNNTWTAPAAAGGPYTITATSVDDPTQSASTTVTVVVAPKITAFTLINYSTFWGLNATYTGGTGVVDQSVGALASGNQANLGLTHADVYTLTVTNAAGTAVTRTASAITFTRADSLNPPVKLLPGQTYDFGGLITVNNAANQGLNYATTAGSITSAGLFTAPMAIEACTMTATSQADPTKNLPIAIQILPLVLPQTQSVVPSASFVFQAPILGPNKAITWNMLSGNIGTISSNGVFTSNGTSGSDTVQAISVADNTIIGTAYVSVPASAYSNSLTANAGAMTYIRTEHALVRTYFNDAVLAIGGLSGGSPTNTMEVSFSGGGGWSLEASTLATARSRHTATLLTTGNILITGGRDASGNPLASAELYDSHNDKLLPAPASMQSAREDHIATLMQDGRVLLTGGRGASGTLNTAEIYDPATNSFIPVATAMSSSRVGHSVVALLDGRVLVTGGSTDGTDANLTNSADLFDPTTVTFTSVSGTMALGRRNMGAALSPDGKVALIGGVYISVASGLPIPSSAAETFDPTTATFATVGTTLSNARNRPLVSILSDGTILALGGSANLGLTGDQNGTASTVTTLDRYLPSIPGIPNPYGITIAPNPGADLLSGRCILMSSGGVLIVGVGVDPNNGGPVSSATFQ